MERAVILICLLALAQGRVLNVDPRIVNGTDAKIGELPFQVTLQLRGSHSCGGSIINEEYVVTAGHCVKGVTLSILTVVAGTINLKKPGQSRQVIRIKIHEAFSPANSYKNDIALIKVSPPFEFNEVVQPVALPESHAKLAINSTAVVSGWGRLGGNSLEIPDVLKKVSYLVADPEYCKEVVKKKGHTIHPSQMCAIDRENRKGECNGDSGGPVTVNGKLAGIVSWSIKDPYCASTTYPGVQTRVSEFIDWIAENAV